ncbi:FAD-binding oxidoreductase [Ruegeria pomeroyi]|uniref:Oxidoreductase, FAD-binding protein n=2 Tax=Ruegeria pomeroyi TaxID=89184 RepID=Q5LVQ8_RUEPO|nr:FAD-dependent oxidoreductase [Ruegeria pomeroyi]AAV93950.1 oxidoreductase, FAD-binding protein [Ruegeria pomeroyi DSS-3]NVK98413.1 FAD-binding oxidoreductase [Ruegeria pomeroyi]NVL02854.1 FAD-binding oxidoreductase [Ruegeria pomeroyi]QWV07538.1 FAD-binding oxidoreductase [Ruegeria pomeroyi]
MIDFLVIGGGIAGLSAGARLSAHGKVTVLEAEEALGYHASGRSAALFEQAYGKPAVVALNRASAAYHHTANGGYLTPRGLMLVGAADQAEAFQADIVDMEMTPVSLDEARAMVPILNPETVVYTAYHAEAWDIDTDRLMQDFARVIRANGGAVLTRQRVSRIAHGAVWQVEAGEVFEARNIVNAAGAWADQVAVMAGVAPIGLQPYRRSMARIPAPGGHDLSGWPMLMGAGESWYAKPDAGKLIISPADADPVEPQDAWADDMVLAEGLARYQEMVTEEVTRMDSNWAGLRSFAPDRVLVLGPDPDQRDFIWCAGQGGYGFQTSPAASQLLCDLVTGAAPEIEARMVAQLRPERLR